MGIYSCIGKNKKEVLTSLYEGRSGISFAPERKELGYRSALCGIVDTPDLKGVLDRRQRMCLSEHGRYAVAATLEALDQAQLSKDYLAKNEVGILYGNDSSAEAIINGVDIIREKRKTVLVGSSNIFQSMNSTLTMNLATIFNLRGINFTVSGACASSSHAVGMGYTLIKQGMQECIICGGAEEVNKYAVSSFDALEAFSVCENEPEKASRPFDRSRDGLVPSGGAATLVLESYESALRRGANILAEVIGYGFSSNGENISVPNVDGPRRSLAMAIKNAGIKPEEVDYVNAHATSTLLGDKVEAQAIAEIFGKSKPLVASTKSLTGHEMWMAGASEIIYSTLMMHNNFVAANKNFEEPDEFSALLNIPRQRVDTETNTFLSNSFGFGGTNSTIIVRKNK